MVRCLECGVHSSNTTLHWDSEHGWHARCAECRLVPTVTGPGEWKLIKIGDK